MQETDELYAIIIIMRDEARQQRTSVTAARDPRKSFLFPALGSFPPPPPPPPVVSLWPTHPGSSSLLTPPSFHLQRTYCISSLQAPPSLASSFIACSLTIHSLTGLPYSAFPLLTCCSPFRLSIIPLFFPYTAYFLFLILIINYLYHLFINSFRYIAFVLFSPQPLSSANYPLLGSDCCCIFPSLFDTLE